MVIGKALAGEMFGEIAVLCGKPQPYTFQTKEISQLLRLNKASLMNILQTNAGDEHKIMNNLFQKLKGSGSLGHLDQQIDQGLGSSNWLDGGRNESIYSHAGDENNAYADTGMLNVMVGNSPNSEAMVEKQGNYCDKGISNGDGKSIDGDDQTALHAAVLEGQHEMVKFLLERGASVSKPDARGWTPIALAAQQANKSIYELLLCYIDKGKPDEHRIEFLPETAKATAKSPVKPTTDGTLRWSKSCNKTPTEISCNHSHEVPTISDIGEVDREIRTPT